MLLSRSHRIEIALPSHWDLYPTSGQIRWKRMRFQAIHWTRGTLVHGLHGYHDLCIFMPASPRTEANATQMHVLTTSSADKSLRLWDVLGTKFHDDNQSKWSSNEEEYWHQWCPEGCVALCFTCFSSEETRFLRSKDSKNGRHLNSDDSMMCFFNMSHIITIINHHKKRSKNLSASRLTSSDRSVAIGFFAEVSDTPCRNRRFAGRSLPGTWKRKHRALL